MKTLCSLSWLLSSVIACAAQAGVVNLSLQGPQSVSVNEEFGVSLMASGNDSVLAMDAILSWNPSDLQFLGVSHQGSHPLMWASESGIRFPDFYGINELAIPTDGTALYTGYVQLGNAINASSSFQVTILRFRALTSFESTSVSFLQDLNINYPCHTAVYGGGAAGTEVTGTLTGMTIIPSSGSIAMLAACGLTRSRRRKA